VAAGENEVFQAVLDESGYEAADPKYPDDAFVFAGYMGTASDWADLTHAWKPIIEAHPELENTNVVKRLLRGGRHHTSWSPKAIALMKAVVDNKALGSIRWKLPYQEYRKVVVTHSLGGDENIYVFAWFAVLLTSIAAISAIPGATLDFIYDQNIHEEPKVQAGYEQLRQFMERDFPEVAAKIPYRPHPMNDNNFWPLRAADGLAWNTHRHYTQTAEGRQFSNPLWRLLDSGVEVMNETWTADDVKDVLRRPNQPHEFLNRRLRALWESMTKTNK
jgi:hypothetical protein